MASLVLGAIGGYFFGPVGYLIGSTIGSMLGPQSKQEGPRLKNLHLHGSDYGKAIPIIYGQMRTAGNVDFTTDLKEHKHKTGGKGGPLVTTYTYTATFSVKICEGPIESIGRVWANGTVIYDPSGGTPGLPDLPLRIYLGGLSQMPDPSLEAEIGAGKVSANRGYVYAVFHDWDLGDYGNTIPNLNWEVIQHGGPASGPIVRIDQNYDMQTFYGQPAITQWNRGGQQIRVDDVYSEAIALDYGPRSPTVTPYYVNTYTTTLSFTGNVPVGGKATDAFPLPLNMCNEPPAAVGQECHYQAIGVHYINADLPKVPLWIRASFNGSGIYPTPTGVSIDDKFPMIASSDMYEYWPYGSLDLNYPSGIEYARSFGIPVGTFIYGASLSQDTHKLYLFCGTTTFGSSMTKWYEIVGGAISREGDIDPPIPAGGLGYGNSCGRFASVACSSMENNGEWLWVYSPPFAGPAGSYTGGTVLLFRINPDDNKLAFDSTGGYAEVGGPGGSSSSGSGLVIQTGYFGVVRGDGRLAVFTRFSGEPGNTKLYEILNDISVRCGLTVPDQVNTVNQTQIVPGYMLDKQMDGRSAINQLQPIYYFDGVERAGVATFVNRGNAPCVSVPDKFLAAMVPGSEGPPLVGVKRMQESDLPANFILNYVNGAADYQVGSQYARRTSTTSQSTATLEVPVNLSDEYASGVCWANLTATWMERTKTTVKLARNYWWYEPTDVMVAHGYIFRAVAKHDDRVGILTFEGVVTNALTWVQGPTTGSGGGFTPSPPGTKSPAAGLLLDIPLVVDTDFQFGKYAAIAGTVSTAPFGGAVVFESTDAGATYNAVATINTPAVMGQADDTLGPWRGGNFFDVINSFLFNIGDGGGELESFTREAVMNGNGAYLVGNEIVYACTAEETATIGTWRISNMLRGRRGTEWAMGAHAAGERVVALPVIDVDGTLSDLGLARMYKIVGTGYSLASVDPFTFTNEGAAARPYSPSHVGGAPIDPFDGTVRINWIRRTRVGGAWNDYVNVPLSETTEAYVVQIWDASYTLCARVEHTTAPTFDYTAAMQVVDFGAIQENIYVTVGQVGAYKLGIQTPAVIPGLGVVDSAPAAPVPPFNSSPPPSGGGCTLPVTNSVLDWTLPNVRIFNSAAGPDGTWVIAFTPGAAIPGVGKINIAEYGGPPVPRVATISETPCGPALGGAFYSAAGGTAPLIFFAMTGYNTSPSQYPTLQSGVTYYITVNSAAPSGASAIFSLPA